MVQMLSLLINLDENTERLQTADAQLRAARITYEKIPAIDGRALDTKTFSQYNRRKALAHFGRELTGAEIGCYLSHLACFRRIIASDAEVALIFEDDIILEPGTKSAIAEIIHGLSKIQNTQWDAVNIGSSMKPKYRTRAFGLSAHSNSVCYSHLYPLKTHATIWHRRAVKRFINEHSDIWMPIDQFVRHVLTRRGSGFCLERPLVVQSEIASAIDASGHRLDLETGLHRVQKWRMRRAERFTARHYRRTFRQQSQRAAECLS